jgi:hypothetical protein
MIKFNWPPYIQLQLTPDCTKEDNCKVEHKAIVAINATLKVNRCPENIKDYKQELVVGPVSGGLEDKLNIRLEITCQCPCEQDGSGVTNSEFCSGSGTLQCGICNCYNDR